MSLKYLHLGCSESFKNLCAGEVWSRNIFDYFTYTETLWMSTVIRVRLCYSGREREDALAVTTFNDTIASNRQVAPAGERRSQSAKCADTHCMPTSRDKVAPDSLWVVFTVWRSFRNHKSQLKKGNGLLVCLLPIFITVLLLFSLSSDHCLPPSFSTHSPISLPSSFNVFLFFFLFFFFPLLSHSPSLSLADNSLPHLYLKQTLSLLFSSSPLSSYLSASLSLPPLSLPPSSSSSSFSLSHTVFLSVWGKLINLELVFNLVNLWMFAML